MQSSINAIVNMTGISSAAGADESQKRRGKNQALGKREFGAG